LTDFDEIRYGDAFRPFRDYKNSRWRTATVSHHFENEKSLLRVNNTETGSKTANINTKNNTLSPVFMTTDQKQQNHKSVILLITFNI